MVASALRGSRVNAGGAGSRPALGTGTTCRYNSYSGAAIGGTLLTLVAISYLDGLLIEIVQTFVVSALIGGGLGAYLSLRKDAIGEQVNKAGGGLVGLFD